MAGGAAGKKINRRYGRFAYKQYKTANHRLLGGRRDLRSVAVNSFVGHLYCHFYYNTDLYLCKLSLWIGPGRNSLSDW
jgi:hypothetical protein